MRLHVEHPRGQTMQSPSVDGGFIAGQSRRTRTLAGSFLRASISWSPSRPAPSRLAVQSPRAIWSLYQGMVLRSTTARGSLSPSAPRPATFTRSTAKCICIRAWADRGQWLRASPRTLRLGRGAHGRTSRRHFLVVEVSFSGRGEGPSWTICRAPAETTRGAARLRRWSAPGGIGLSRSEVYDDLSSHRARAGRAWG